MKKGGINFRGENCKKKCNWSKPAIQHGLTMNDVHNHNNIKTKYSSLTKILDKSIL